ncbi:hypothetical protein ALI44B_08235 [Leifsonia sp. ALI-44-B]|jgi:prevent-host-death family protein|uniref:type II toxin-antitoxin system Phd/YefM family antitoxin n=1 Tax=Leifsonia sp. ALI-44-B TaxID=1933776 RepID=UPI00097C07F1|nr:type II toxin-antitoxin system prevent-host-death family antitoxin [Leifsonia sp. ALI-44-B]ONI60582.1 hypothetical protein ALI44B_08235 [Leifsonia sp. ALI-44-B]
MHMLSATEASRSFAAVLDDAEHGETIVITRGGRRIATIGPASASNGAAFLALLKDHNVDPDFAADVASVDEVLAEEGDAWPAD